MKIIDIREATVRSTVEGPLELPEYVEVELTGGIIERYPVEWEQVDPAQLASPGEFIVEGKIIEDDFPNPLVEQRADPYILKHTDGYYYFTGSVPEYDRIVLRRARTIAGLATAEEHVIWRKHDVGEMGNHIWAPETFIISMVVGISILQLERLRTSGISAHMCSNVQMRIRSLAPGRRKVGSSCRSKASR